MLSLLDLVLLISLMIMNNTNSRKIRAAQLSIVSNISLIIMKVFAGIITGSVSIISEAIHSAMDLLASIIAFFAVRISGKPADNEHPFGHGKFENVSGVIEALLIFGAAIWIVYEALDKLLHKGHMEYSGSFTIGIIVMFIAGVVNYFVSKHLYKVAKDTDSIALEADALHLKADVYTSVGVGLGLLLIELTGLYFLDPIIAILVALFIVREAYHMLLKAFNPLLDSSLNDNELKNVEKIIALNTPLNTVTSNLRTRKSGSNTFIQFTLNVDPNITTKEAVELRKTLENKIKNEIQEIEIIVVLDYK